MKKLLSLAISVILLSQTSCETDKSRIEECEKIVKDFTSNLPLDNYDILYKYYPTMPKIKTYWKIQNFKISNSSIDKDGTVSVIGFGSNKNLMFILKKVSGNYVIQNSKGLASAYDSYLYKYCKQIGCIGINNYDTDLSEICSSKEYEYKDLIARIKNDIESKFILQNNNLSSNFGYLSGDLTMKNGSRFTIPAFTYQINYNFMDDNGNVLFTSKESANYSSIPYGESLTRSLYESNSGSFRRIGVHLSVTSTDFIETIITENAKGNSCVLSTDF